MVRELGKSLRWPETDQAEKVHRHHGPTKSRTCGVLRTDEDAWRINNRYLCFRLLCRAISMGSFKPKSDRAWGLAGYY